jgi:hypothetical protein
MGNEPATFRLLAHASTHHAFNQTIGHRLLNSGTWSGNLLLAFASTVILDFGPRGTSDHIFLSHDSTGKLGYVLDVFMRFMVDEMVLEQVLLRVYSIFPC